MGCVFKTCFLKAINLITLIFAMSLLVQSSILKGREWTTEGRISFFDAVGHALRAQDSTVRTLYSSYSLLWETCTDATAHMEYGGVVFHDKFCLWGNMLPHKLAVVLSLIRHENITVLIESGRKGGMSTFTYSKIVPRVISVELHPVAEVTQTLSTLANNVELLSGDGKSIVPRVVEECSGRGERVAVILDGPKGRSAVSLVPRILNQVVFVGLDDLETNSKPWKILHRYANGNLFSTSSKFHLMQFLPLDEAWALQFRRRTKTKQLSRILKMANCTSLHNDFHLRSALVITPGIYSQWSRGKLLN